MGKTRGVYKIWVGKPCGKHKAFTEEQYRGGRDEHFSSVAPECLHGSLHSLFLIESKGS
jgi:hypothetical protein